MSADRQRLTSAIRRIAKTDPEIRGILDAADNKGGKPGAAGVGSSTDAESQRICCDGSVSDNANPGTEERDPDSGSQSGGLDSTDPAKLDMGEGTLSGVTDCATGEPICFSGSGFIPPDGWDEPSEPGPVESYLEGHYWAEKSFGNPTGPTDWTAEQRCDPDDVEIYDGNIEARCYTGGSSTPGSGFTTARIYLFNCSENPSSICSETPDPLIADSWPEDSCVNLSIAGGKIVGSKYDPENDGSYSAPRDSIDLCSGGDQISLAPAANGGWKTINSTNDSGYLYDSKGKVIAHIDGNEYSDPAI